MKLYCDEMLIGLGRWLRAAGYDTRIARHAISDRQILQQSISEHRKLLTRDRKLVEFRDAARVVVLLQCAVMQECVAEATSRLDIDWLYRPFSRCLACNTPLLPATVEQVTHLNAMLKKNVRNIYYCAPCDQLFWEGSHVRRMRTRLLAFNQLYRDS